MKLISPLKELLSRSLCEMLEAVKFGTVLQPADEFELLLSLVRLKCINLKFCLLFCMCVKLGAQI
jgi:hypothetical protein